LAHISSSVNILSISFNFKQNVCWTWNNQPRC